MKDKLVLILVISTLVVATAVTAHAYTYTCEEGRFQIEVPEGWTVKPVDCWGVGRGTLTLESGGNEEATVTITWGKLGSGRSLRTYHDEALGPDQTVAVDKYLNEDEARLMGVDDGYILRDGSWCEARFLRTKRLYHIQSVSLLWSQIIENDIVSILNSFRALD